MEIGGVVIYTINIQINIFLAIIFFIIFLFGIFSFLLFVKLKHKDYRKKKKRELNHKIETKTLLREQRHDYMNMFQIIYGYLQLKNYEKAIEYLKKSINLSLNISKCHYLSNFSISLLIEKKLKEAESKGLEIILDVESYPEEEVKDTLNDKLALHYISKIFDVFIECTYKNKGKLYIYIYEHLDRIGFIFSGDIDVNILDTHNNLLKNFVKKNEEYEVVFYYDRIKELLSEYNICSA